MLSILPLRHGFNPSCNTTLPFQGACIARRQSGPMSNRCHKPLSLHPHANCYPRCSRRHVCFRFANAFRDKGITGRRGIAGTILVQKVACAAAAAGLPLDAVSAQNPHLVAHHTLVETANGVDHIDSNALALVCSVSVSLGRGMIAAAVAHPCSNPAHKGICIAEYVHLKCC